MPLSNDDWREIEKLVTRVVSQVGEPFVQGKVVKNDPVNKLVWLKEFGDQPIPCIGFHYRLKYYDTRPKGNVVAGQPVKTERKPVRTPDYSRDVEILVPRVGDVVLVARHFGSRRLPKCLGIIKSKKYVSK